MIMPTGGVGKYGPAEAVAMRRALVEAGVAASRIVVERYGRDTLESVRLCHQLLQERGDCQRIVCCTSTYHQPRCVLLFRLLGYTVVVPRVPNSMGRMSRTTYGKLVVRELAATPYDSLLLLLAPGDATQASSTHSELESEMGKGPMKATFRLASPLLQSRRSFILTCCS